MAFRGNNFNQTETDNWNVAKGFTNDVTLEHFRDLRKFERIARYGVFDFENKYLVSPAIKIDARIEGLNWYADELDSLVSDNVFAIKPKHRKKDVPRLNELREEVEELKKGFWLVTKETVVRDKKRIEIQEEAFSRILKQLIEIKMEVFEILNRSDLIFKGIDEFDPEFIKESLFTELTETG